MAVSPRWGTGSELSEGVRSPGRVERSPSVSFPLQRKKRKTRFFRFLQLGSKGWWYRQHNLHLIAILNECSKACSKAGVMFVLCDL